MRIHMDAFHVLFEASQGPPGMAAEHMDGVSVPAGWDGRAPYKNICTLFGGRVWHRSRSSCSIFGLWFDRQDIMQALPHALSHI